MRRKSLSKLRLVQLNALHRSIFRQIRSRRFAQVDISTDFCTGSVSRTRFRQIPTLRFEEVDISTDFSLAVSHGPGRTCPAGGAKPYKPRENVENGPLGEVCRFRPGRTCPAGGAKPYKPRENPETGPLGEVCRSRPGRTCPAGGARPYRDPRLCCGHSQVWKCPPPVGYAS